MITRTHQTLLEQMQISDAEIRNRLALVEMPADGIKALKKAAALIEENVDDLVKRFYELQLSIDEIAALIGDADTLARLKSAQRQYILDLFSGQYDGNYVNNRLRIGMVHKRIGVEPKLYLSAIRSLREILFDVLPADDLHTRDALDKLLHFDTTLVVDTYIASMISEIEAARQKTAEYANSLEEKVAERTAELEALARKDPLTGLLNQRAMYEMATHALAVSKRRKTPMSIAYFDVDKFKQINDKLGHLKGDEVLKNIGKALHEAVREVDIASRYGGDEFCVILPETDAELTVRVCKRIIELFTRMHPKFSLSIGVYQFDGHDANAIIENLINEADTRMYKAKKVKGSHIQL